MIAVSLSGYGFMTTVGYSFFSFGVYFYVDFMVLCLTFTLVGLF
jgi:hypothetical protein